MRWIVLCVVLLSALPAAAQSLAKLTITAVTVTTSAVAMPTTAAGARKGLWIHNTDASVSIYCGVPSVTAGQTTGHEVKAGERHYFGAAASTAVQCTVASGTVASKVEEVL